MNVKWTAAVIILHLPHRVQYACIVVFSSSLKIQGLFVMCTTIKAAKIGHEIPRSQASF